MDIKIAKLHLQELNTWFSEYVSGFKVEDPHIQKNIEIKEAHSLRVRDEILYLASGLGLNEDQKRLAAIIGLYHDIGRFEQFTVYKTFNDRESANHADLGLKVIEENNVLDKLGSLEKEIIVRAIAYHNRPIIPEGETGPYLFFEKLIRDADKLDIYHLVTSFYHGIDTKRNGALELGVEDTPGFTPSIVDDLMHCRFVKRSEIQNLNDFKLFQIGWIFDVNFPPALKRIHQKGYLNRIREVLPKDQCVDDIFSRIQSTVFRSF